MVLETGSRIGQDTLFFPDFQREKLERALMDQIGGDFEEIAYQRLRRLGYLHPGEKINLNLSLETIKNPRLVNLFHGILGNGWASVDFILPWTEIYRPSQIIERRPGLKIDAPSIYHLWTGRLGIYKGKDLQREEILHDMDGYDDEWGFSITSGRSPHRLNAWEKPAYLLTTVPDTFYISPEQISLPL